VINAYDVHDPFGLIDAASGENSGSPPVKNTRRIPAAVMVLIAVRNPSAVIARGRGWIARSWWVMRGRDLALVVAEPAAELAARGERDAELPAAAGEVGSAACQAR
jgi:hypothetical protein